MAYMGSTDVWHILITTSLSLASVNIWQEVLNQNAVAQRHPSAQPVQIYGRGVVIMFNVVWVNLIANNMRRWFVKANLQAEQV